MFNTNGEVLFKTNLDNNQIEINCLGKQVKIDVVEIQNTVFEKKIIY